MPRIELVHSAMLLGIAIAGSALNIALSLNKIAQAIRELAKAIGNAKVHE